MKTLMGILTVAAISALLVGFAEDDRSDLFQLRQCDVDVNPGATGSGAFTMVAYYRLEDRDVDGDGSTEPVATTSFSPPLDDYTALSDWVDTVSTRIPMREFQHNKAELVYWLNEHPPTMSLLLTNGTDENRIDDVPFLGTYDPNLDPEISVTLVPYAPIDNTHNRERVWVDFRGLHSAFTLIDL